MLLKGQGTTPDVGQALQWCSAAAEQGLAEAQLQLGDLYRAGRGVNGDIDVAAAWYRKAAQQGNVEAVARLDSLLDDPPAPVPVAGAAG
jgi:uncharacterized protein